MRNLTLSLVAAVLVFAPAAGASEQVNALNSSVDWIITNNVQAADAAATLNHLDCPQQLDEASYACATEYYLTDRNGNATRRWTFVNGRVAWNDLTYAGNRVFGDAVSQVDYRSSWIRRWHHDPARCLARSGVRGYVVSNMPCATVGSLIAHGNPRVGQLLGTGTGYWPWLFQFPCRRRAGWSTCANGVGDSYRFKAFPTVGPYR